MGAKGNPSAKLSHRMSTQDASFIYAESHSGPLHIGSLNFLDAHLDHDELIDHMARRIHLLPRYRQRLAFAPFNLAHATLEEDPDFDLRNHIKCHSLPDGSDEAAFVRAAMAVYEPMLDRNKPLWECHLFQGLEGGRSAIVWKVHHCLVDGVSGMELLTVALDFRAEPPPPEPPEKPWKPGSLPSAFRRFASAVIDLAEDRLDEVRQLAELAESPRVAAERAAILINIVGKMARMAVRQIVAAPWNSALVSSTRSIAWLNVPSADLRLVRNALGGTVNDVVLTILSEAAARYLKHHEVSTGFAPLRIGCPVNVRHSNEGGALGNRVSMMFPELPSEPMAVEARLQSVISETSRIKAGGEPRALELMLSASDLIPPTLMGLSSFFATNAVEAASRLAGLAPGLARMIKLPAPGINFIATNVPGAQVPLYLAGRKMTQMVGLVPLGANLGFNVVIVAYNQDLVFGMIAEPRLMPDVGLMRSFAAEVVDQLMAAARAKPASESGARGPGEKSAATRAA